MSWVQIWVHLVFSTQQSVPFLSTKTRNNAILHLKKISKEKGIYLQSIYGSTDALHCLVSLAQEQSIDQVARVLQEAGSLYCNADQEGDSKVTWLGDFWVASVSEKDLNGSIAYFKKKNMEQDNDSFDDAICCFETIYGGDLCKKS